MLLLRLFTREGAYSICLNNASVGKYKIFLTLINVHFIWVDFKWLPGIWIVTLKVKIVSSYHPGSENLPETSKNSNESPYIQLGATFINFLKFFPRLRLFQGLRLLILNKIPKATFIKEATSIRDSRVNVLGGNFL